MFSDIRAFVSLASYGTGYDMTDEGASGPANIFDAVSTSNADIWPGGHGVAGQADGDTVTVNYTKFANESSGSAWTPGSFSWISH